MSHHSLRVRKYIIVFGVYFFAHYSRGPSYCWSNSILMSRANLFPVLKRVITINSLAQNCESFTGGRPCGEEVGISPSLQLHTSQKSYAKR